MITFRVYEKDTNRDVTGKKDWYIDPDGDLRFLTTDISFPMSLDTKDYYYKIEIEVGRPNESD